MSKEFVTLIDGNGEKYEVLGKNDNKTTVKNYSGMIFNIPNIYLTNYETWLLKNKKCKSNKST